MNSSEIHKVKECLLNTKFFIKEQRNNFSTDSIVSISCKIEDTNRRTQMMMFNAKNFNVSNLKDKIDEALISNEPTVKNFIQEYYELGELLNPLFKKLEDVINVA